MDVRAERRGVATASLKVCLIAIVCCTSAGCWAPLHSPGTPANTLPDCFRTPIRTAGPPLNFANLTARAPGDYLLGANDILEVTVAELYQGVQVQPIRVQIMADGHIHLPLVGAVPVGGGNLTQAQDAITKAFADGYIDDPRVNVALAQKATVDIVVLGEVKLPGVHPLPERAAHNSDFMCWLLFSNIIYRGNDIVSFKVTCGNVFTLTLAVSLKVDHQDGVSRIVKQLCPT